ncbi:MAG: PAS domain-containing protein, partial [Methylocystaceae bacterium]
MIAERFYENVIQNAPIGYSLSKLVYDASGSPIDLELMEVNPAFEIMTGFKQEQIIGSRISTFFPNTTEWLPFCVALTGKHGARPHEEYSPVLNRWYKGYIYSPAPNHIISLFYDITDQKRISEEKSSLMSSLYDIIFELNHDFEVIKLYSQDESYLLLPPRDIIGKKLPDLLEEALSTRFLEVCLEAAKTGVPSVLEYRVELQGKKHWFRATIVP